jgi:hypothetical protein
MPYTPAQRRRFHAGAGRGEPGMAKLASEADSYAREGKELPEHKGAAHNMKKDEGSAGNKREESPEKGEYGKGEKPEKPMKRGPFQKRTEGGNEKKGSAYGAQKKTPSGGDVSGNEHDGKSAVEATGSADGEHPDGGDVSGETHSHDHQHNDQHDGTHQHTHHHEDIHIHLGGGIANEGDATSMMHQNPHSGFGRPPMNPAGAVPMYSASQQGITMNDSHTSGGGANAFAGRGTAAPAGVRSKSNPVQKGRG